MNEQMNVLIGCPAYGGAVQHVFVSSLIALSQTLVNHGINHQIKFLGNQSIIGLARDHFANALFDGDSQGRPFTHLLFLDVDQGFGVADVLTMIRANKEIIALPASPKSIQWEQVALAARRGVPAEQLQHFTARPNFEDLPGASYATNEIAQVDRIGTALCLIRKSVFEKLAAAHPDWEARRFSNEKQSDNPHFHFFQVGIDPTTKLMLAEGLFFCAEARKLGIEVWIVPSAVTTHVGTYSYMMNMPALASLGSSPTTGD